MLAHLLSKADVSYVDLPLEALVCEQHFLSPVPDYPLAAIAVSEDGLDAGDAYWLRADPVHLVLQRDSFSLSEPCPLPVLREHAEAIMASLNQHFEQDGLKFCLGNSGAWYVRLAQPPQIKTALPAMAMGKNIAHYMPQGVEASHWVAYLNEVQMLLHGHAANAARELVGDVVINSVWLSGGGVMPAPITTKPAVAYDRMIGSHVFYQGLARRSGVVYQSGVVSQKVSLFLQDTISQFTKQSNVRLQLTQEMLLEESTFQVLLNALKTKKISQLVIHLACYEQTLVAKINPIDLYKFWRKSKPMSAYLV
jgi:hypothetical protein